MKETSLQILFFILVGSLAAIVHYSSVVYILVPQLQLSPLLANIFGFLIAFQVSYFGHFYLSFAAQTQKQHSQSWPRFVLVASLGFASNQLLYYIFLDKLHIPHDRALIIVLVLVAILSFTLSKLWAFTHHK
jgi:putative flippase GtrA